MGFDGCLDFQNNRRLIRDACESCGRALTRWRNRSAEQFRPVSGCHSVAARVPERGATANSIFLESFATRAETAGEMTVQACLPFQPRPQLAQGFPASWT